MEWALAALALFSVILNKAILKRYISSFTLIILPYIAIVLINNLFISGFGFYRVTGDTMCILLIAGIIFYFAAAGASVVQSRGGVCAAAGSALLPNVFNMKRVSAFVSAVLMIRLVQLVGLFLRHGLSGIIANDFRLLLARGIIGHLMISVFPLIPLLFYEWLTDRRKNRYYLLLTLVYFFFAFIETEKAQVLSVSIAVFLYCVFMNEKYLVRGALILVSLVVVFFIGNYVMKLILQGFISKVTNDYYIYRLWNYIAGGIINSRILTEENVIIHTDALDYLADVLLSFPNMILGGLTGSSVGPDVLHDFPLITKFIRVTNYTSGYRSQTGNVLSTISYAYGNGSLPAFALVMALWGAVSESIMGLVRRAADNRHFLFVCSYMTFSFLSFFGSYYTGPSFTERLLYCVLWAFVFHKTTIFYI